MANLEHLIDTSMLQAFGRGTVVPLGRSVVSLAEAAEALSERVEAALDNKVDKIPGKGLSANDYTDQEKARLNAAEAAAANAYSRANDAYVFANELHERTGYDDMYLGNSAASVGGSSLAIGNHAKVGGNSSIAVGSFADVLGSASIAIGMNASASEANSIAVGHLASATNTNGIAVGAGAIAKGQRSIAIGFCANVNSSIAIAIGNSASATGSGCIVVGEGAKARESYSIAIGAGTNATASSSIAIGDSASATRNSSVALGEDARTSNSYSIQLGSPDTLSSITARVPLTVTSDRRDKADVEAVPDGATEFLRKVRAVTYVFNGRGMYIDEGGLSEGDKEKRAKYGLCAYDREAHAAGTKKGSRRRVGVVAQEVQEALRESFGSASYANLVNDNFFDLDKAEIPDDVENQLAVNYEGFIPFLIKAVQELDGRVGALENGGGHS